ncbi:MAG: T9SS type A sorting domain-containing protein [Flavobacteriales bacterium]|nr:T9SS type A sorting domain-containing protein [Flavobacteriales bacterium]
MNPMSGGLKVVLGSGDLLGARLFVFDAKGSKVFETPIGLMNSIHQLQNLNAGIYIYQFRKEWKQTTSKIHLN